MFSPPSFKSTVATDRVHVRRQDDIKKITVDGIAGLDTEQLLSWIAPRA
jgi:hypothetical protein